MSKNYTLTEDKLAKCNECGKEVKPKGFSAHWRIVHLKLQPHNEGRTAWNKGLNGDIDERVAKNSASVAKTMNEKVKDGWRPYFSTDEFWTQERRLAKSQEKKKYFQEYPEEHPNRKLAGNHEKMTYPEQVANNWFKSNKIEALHNVKIEGFYPDFLIDNVIVEIDGKYWHDDEKDAKRDKILIEAGYTVYRIPAENNIEKELETIFGM